MQCVMEIFTYLRMGGEKGGIDLEMISAASMARENMNKQLESFDAANAQCFLAKDRHKLLAVVEAGFGDFKEFNKLVRNVFKEKSSSKHLLAEPSAEGAGQRSAKVAPSP